MGLSSSKTTQTTEPSAYAKGYITPAADTARSTYNAQAGNIADISSNVQGLIPGLVSRYTEGTPGVNAAKGYNTDVLTGKYLSGNPFLEKLISQTNDSVGDTVNAKIGTRGLAGGSAQTKLLADELAKNETGLRYGDYNAERSRMDGAVGAAGGLEGVDNANLAAILAAAQSGASLPFTGSDALTRQIAALVGNSNTTTQNKGLDIGSLLGSAMSSAALAFSDRRLKENIEQIGALGDGLGVYRYNYLDDETPQVGVMADEVADLRPWALGPVIEGFATVDYGRL